MKRWFILEGILITAFFVTLAIAGTNSTVTRGKTFTSTETVTSTKLHTLVDDADVTGLKLGAFGSTIRPITISATAPSSPSEGDYWYDTSTLLLKQSRSSVWVRFPNIVYLGAESTDPDTVASIGILYQKDIYDSTIGDTIPTLYFRPDGAGTPQKISSGNPVTLTGDQTVAGEKTWSDTQNFQDDTVFDSRFTHGLDVYKAPTLSREFAPKGYVDAQITASGADRIQVDTLIGTDNITTSSTTYVDMTWDGTQTPTEDSYTDTFVACNVNIVAKIPIRTNNEYAELALLVDSVVVDSGRHGNENGGWSDGVVTLSWSGAVTAASHAIKVQWRVNGGTTPANNGTSFPRRLTIIRGLN